MLSGLTLVRNLPPGFSAQNTMNQNSRQRKSCRLLAPERAVRFTRMLGGVKLKPVSTGL